MENKKILPLGSIVYLREGNKKVLIVARGLIAKNVDGYIYFDYCGVLYPEGLVDDKMAYFQQDAINKVVFEGYTDLDDQATVEKIKFFVENHPDIPRVDVKQLLNK